MMHKLPVRSFASKIMGGSTSNTKDSAGRRLGIKRWGAAEVRKGEIIGEHEVSFSSGKEIVSLNHEAFDRSLYSEGALFAAEWLIKKKPGLYSMRNVLNFK